MTDEGVTDNPFAVTLVYYYCYCRSKLTCEDLQRIQRKYESRPQNLLRDLQKKYIFKAPSSVTWREVARVVGCFDVPADFVRVAGISVEQRRSFEKSLDICSNEFDVEAVFSRKKIFASSSKHAPLDNMMYCKTLVPGLVSPEEIAALNDRMRKSAQRKMELEAAEAEGKEVGRVDNRHFFEQLAEKALPKYSFRSDLGVEIVLPSPCTLIYNCMKNHERVRIITRRQNGIRGSMDAYIQAFDRHFNLFLTDVDEEYILNKVPSSFLNEQSY